MKQKVSANNLKYFHSQHMLISLFDELQKMGMDRIYKDKLLEIAYLLMDNAGMDKPVQYSAADWEYQDYDNSVGCDSAIKEFIDSINIYNKNNFVMDKNLLSSFTKKISDYTDQLLFFGDLGEKDYLEIVQKIFKQFEDQNADIGELWELLINVSRKYDKEYHKNHNKKYAICALKNALNNLNDDLDIIRYSHLITELEKREYFESQETEMDYV